MGTARSHFTVTPTDGLKIYADALWIGGAGTVICKDRDGTQVTYTKPADSHILVQITEVLATSTATNIVGLLY